MKRFLARPLGVTKACAKRHRIVTKFGSRVDNEEPPFCYNCGVEPEEATYREGLSRNWMLRHGQRPDSLSRLCAIADAAVLFAAAGALGLHLVAAAIGIAILGLIFSHTANRYFLKVEKLAFADIEREIAGVKGARHSSHVSPLYPLAKIVMKPRARAKQVWVERRTELFLARRAQKRRQADIFEKQTIKLGSIHGTADAARVRPTS